MIVLDGRILLYYVCSYDYIFKLCYIKEGDNDKKLKVVNILYIMYLVLNLLIK